MKGSRYILIITIQVIGIFLISYYWVSILPQIAGVLHYLKNIKFAYLAVAIVLYILSMCIFANRWKVVLN